MTEPTTDPETFGLVAQAGYLRDQLAVLATKTPVPLPTAEELVAGATADKITAARIHAARPGVPLHHVFAVLQALRAVRALDRAPNADREDRISLDQLTKQDLEQLYDDLDRYAEVVGELNETNTGMARDLAALRQVARGYCGACGRGDAAPTVEDWEQQRQRADRAEASIARVRAVCDQLHRASVLADGQPHTDRERGIVQAVTRVLATLDEPAPAAAAQATEWAPPPPGDRREQLPDEILAAINPTPYLSTACHTAFLCEIADGPEEALAEWATRLHARCRLNNKFTGKLCFCPCHKPQSNA